MTSSAASPGDRLAFIGGGNMARALVAGLLQRGIEPGRIRVADPSDAARRALAQAYPVMTTADNAAALAQADVVILAVKPQQLGAVLAPLAPLLQRAQPPLVLSIAAGIPHAALRRWCGEGVPIVRTMPNQPALTGCGATGLYAPTEVGEQARRRATAIMAAVGVTAWVEREELLDVVTALSGSGPAYFYRFMELLEKAACEQGLPPAVARELTRATAFGAAQLARCAHEPLATLREQVTSPGGTTAAALAVFEADGLERLVYEAFAAAVRRAAELAQAYGGN